MKALIVSISILLSACSFAPIPGVSTPAEPVQAIPTGGITSPPVGCAEGKTRGVQC